MEYESVAYTRDITSDGLTINFDEYIPQLLIPNSCKGRLIEPQHTTEYLNSKLEYYFPPQFTPQPENPPKQIEYQDVPSSSDDKSYKCHFCNYETYSKYKVRMHRKTHIGEAYSCHLCTFKTLNKNDLQQHVKGHVNEKVYKCNFCTFQTLYKTGLKTHLLRHSGNKPFKCYHCDYRAFQKIHVERHAITHSSGKSKHKCRLCHFKTAFKVRLERHLLAHEGVIGDDDQTLQDEQELDEQFSEVDEHLKEGNLEQLEKGEFLQEQELTEQMQYEELQSNQHAIEEQMKCDLCDFIGTENLLVLHLMETHEGEGL